MPGPGPGWGRGSRPGRPRARRQRDVGRAGDGRGSSARSAFSTAITWEVGSTSARSPSSPIRSMWSSTFDSSSLIWRCSSSLSSRRARRATWSTWSRLSMWRSSLKGVRPPFRFAAPARGAAGFESRAPPGRAAARPGRSRASARPPAAPPAPPPRRRPSPAAGGRGRSAAGTRSSSSARRRSPTASAGSAAGSPPASRSGRPPPATASRAAWCSPSAWITLARRSRSASAWRAIARCIVVGIPTSLISTVLTLIPQGSVCSSMICCRSSLSCSRWDSSASRSALPSTDRRVVCEICDVALTASSIATTDAHGSTTRK